MDTQDTEKTIDFDAEARAASKKLSPAQATGFMKGVEYVARRIAEDGGQVALGQYADDLLVKVKTATGRLEERLKDANAVRLTAEEMTDDERRIMDFTVLLATRLREVGSHHSADSIHLRAAANIVCAMLGGSPAPLSEGSTPPIGPWMMPEGFPGRRGF